MTIGNTAGETTYNAFDMKFSYDNTVLKLDMEKTNTEGYRVYPPVQHRSCTALRQGR